MNLFGFGYYEAGWKSTVYGNWRERFGKWWVWIGPYVIGYVRNF